MQSYPLQWPEGWPRTAFSRRRQRSPELAEVEFRKRKGRLEFRKEEKEDFLQKR